MAPFGKCSNPLVPNARSPLLILRVSNWFCDNRIWGEKFFWGGPLVAAFLVRTKHGQFNILNV